MPYQRPRVPIGQRRDLIHVQTPTETDDGMGGQTVTWKTSASLYAAVEPLDERAKEGLRAQQLTVTHGYHVTVPYTTAITPKTRVVYRDVTLQVHTVVDDEARKRRLVLQCVEVQ